MITRGYVRTKVGQVHFRSAGERRTGELPVVLLHQTASSSAMYDALMSDLGKDAYVVAPDTPGFGGTDALPERGSIARYAEVLREALQRLEVQECFLFGHHSGASVAVQMAVTEPGFAKKLILSGPPLLTKAQLEAIVPSVSPVRIEEDGGHMMSVWRRIRAKDPTAPLELSNREAVLNLIAGVRYPEAYDAVFAHDIGSQLKAIECPTLVMVGPDDTIRASAEPATALLKNGRFVLLPRGGTYVCDREPALVAATLRSFFFEESSATKA